MRMAPALLRTTMPVSTRDLFKKKKKKLTGSIEYEEDVYCTLGKLITRRY